MLCTVPHTVHRHFVPVGFATRNPRPCSRSWNWWRHVHCTSIFPPHPPMGSLSWRSAREMFAALCARRSSCPDRNDRAHRWPYILATEARRVIRSSPSAMIADARMQSASFSRLVMSTVSPLAEDFGDLRLCGLKDFRPYDATKQGYSRILHIQDARLTVDAHCI